MPVIAFLILLLCSSITSIKHSDSDYEGVLISLFEHFHVRHCLILEEFKTSDGSMRLYVKSFSKIGVATAVMNIKDFMEIVDSPVGTYSNMAVLLYVSRNRSRIMKLLASFPLYDNIVEDKSIIYIVLMAPGIGSFTEYIYVPLYCQFLIVRPVGEEFFNINEFYSIYEFRKESEWGFWSRKTKLSVTVNKTLFRRRQNFEGTTLIAMYVIGERPDLQRWYWGILEEFYNFTTKYQTIEELLRSGRPEGAQGALINLAMHIKKYSRDAVWPLGKSSYYIFMRRPAEDTSFWTSYLRPFTPNAWLLVLLFVLLIWITILVLKITALEKTKEKFDPVGHGCLPFDTLMNQNGIDVSRSTISFRIGFFVTICFAALLQCLYGGELISYLTTHEYTLPFSDVTGFVKDGTYNITFPKGKYTAVLLSEGLGPFVGNYVSTHYTEFRGYDEVPRHICSERVVFAAEDRIMKMGWSNWPDWCQTVYIPRPLHTVHPALYLQPSSHFTSAFVSLLPQVQETGLYRKAHITYYKKALNDHGMPDLTEVDLPRIQPALTLLFFGAALAHIFLFLEYLVLQCSLHIKKPLK